NQSAAGFHQRGGSGQDRALLSGKLCDASVILAPFEIGIAAQRAESAARRVDQDTVDLAAEPLHANVVFADQQLRVDVGQTGALKPRFELIESVFGHVKRVESAERLHQCTEHERFAAGAGAKIDYHFAPL